MKKNRMTLVLLIVWIAVITISLTSCAKENVCVRCYETKPSTTYDPAQTWEYCGEESEAREFERDMTRSPQGVECYDL